MICIDIDILPPGGGGGMGGGGWLSCLLKYFVPEARSVQPRSDGLSLLLFPLWRRGERDCGNEVTTGVSRSSRSSSANQMS